MTPSRDRKPTSPFATLLAAVLVLASAFAPTRGAAEQGDRPAGLLQPGAPAPDFTLPSSDGKPVTLSKLRGRPVVLYFYPKDESPGCTKQACDFRDRNAELRQAGVVVLGVSSDDVASHKRFAKKQRLPFPLLSDAGGRVAALYGVPVRTVPAVGKLFERTTFVIDKDGKVARAWPKVTIAGHVDEVVRFVRAPGGA